MEIFSIVLSPIVWIMQFVLNIYVQVISSWGIAILLLGFSFSLLLLPLQRYGRKIEKNVAEKITRVNLDIQKIDQSLKGEKRFMEIEKIYTSHGYHPIQQITMGASIFVMLPVLISAIVLFLNNAELAGKSFLLIQDLSAPDHLLGPINILPLIMFLITFIDATLRFKNEKSSFYRFLIISVILVALVYTLPSALVLYWIGNNLSSFIVSRF